MPQAVAVWVASAVTGATVVGGVAAAIAGGAYAYAAVYSATYLVTTALISSAATSYLKKKLTPAANAGAQQRITFESAFPRRKIYGKTLISGNCVYAESSGTDNKNLDMVIVLGEGEIEGIESVYIGQDAVSITSASEGALRTPVSGNKYAANAEFYFHHGASDQTGNSTLAGRQGNWTAAHRLRGIAYVYVRLIYNKDIYTSGIPNLRFVMKGAKVYDPRKDTANGYSGANAHTQTNATTWEYSTNPILALRDFLTLENGLNAQADEIDEARFIEMANSCDDNISLHASNGTTQKRFTVNGAVALDAAKAEVAEALLSTCNGSLVWTQGKYVPQVGVAVPNSRKHTLTADNLRGGIKFTTRASKSQRMNAVRGVFVDAANTYQATDFAHVKNTTYATEDGEELFGDIQLPLTTDNVEAQRLAKQVLEANRQAIEVDFPANMTCFHMQPNDIVELSIDPDGAGGNSAIFTNKKFQIIQWKFNSSGGVDLRLKEYADAVYDWAYGEMTTTDLAPNTTLANPTVVATPTSPQLSFDSAVSADGSFSPAMTVSWSAPSDTSFISDYIIEVQRRVDANAVFATVTTQIVLAQYTSFTFLSVLSGQLYRARVIARNSVGVEGTPSAYSSSTGLHAVDGTAPSVPTSLSGTGGINEIAVNWTNPTEKDFAFAQVYAASSNNSAGASLVGTSAGTSFTHVGLAASTARFYFLKSVDYTGNASGFSASTTATTSAIDQGSSTVGPAGPRGVGIYTLAATGSPQAFPTGTTAQISAAVQTIFTSSAGVGQPIENDKAVLFLGTLAVQTAQKVFIYSGTAWSEVTQYIDGSLVVSGTVDAAKLSATTLSGLFVNAGTITAGTLRNTGNTFNIDLDNGTITIST